MAVIIKVSTMISALNTALSGLDAAGQRIAVSANNIANAGSTYSQVDGETIDSPYVPQDVVQTSLETGGVRTYTRPINPPTVPVFDPSSPQANENGVVNYPNVNVESEVMNTILAKNSYKASMSIIKTQDEMFSTLLDIEG